MPALNIRNLDDALLDQLKRRAAQHHRSVQGEVTAILQAAVRGRGENTDPERALDTPRDRELVLWTVRVGGEGEFSRREIYDDEH